jgi:hypothetical protein
MFRLTYQHTACNVDTILMFCLTNTQPVAYYTNTPPHLPVFSRIRVTSPTKFSFLSFCKNLWISGKLNPPIKKRKTEDKTLYYSEYESSKRMRSYYTEWEEDRPWLKLTDDGMACLTGQAHGDKTVMNQFISGCVCYKLNSIQKHQCVVHVF